jgi:hypothetical protein
MRRRRLLSIIGAGTLSLAGCTRRGNAGDGGDSSGEPGTTVRKGTSTTAGDDGEGPTGKGSGPTVDGRGTSPDDRRTPTGTDPGTRTDPPGTDDTPDPGPGDPDACPTSENLGIAWPNVDDPDGVASFVEAYEAAYYREVVVEYDPGSRFASYELTGSVSTPPQAVGDGWELAYSGSGAVYTPTLLLEATATAPPDGADVVAAGEIDDEAVAGVLEEAAATGAAEHHVETPGVRVDQLVDRFAELSEGFERLSDRQESDTLYVDVDGTSVELSVTPTGFHGDYWWSARYYVDERVVRRTTEEDVDPRNGVLLECRSAG